MRALILVALLVAAPVAARDEKAAAACAAKLAPDGKAIYDSVAPDVKADTNLAELVRAKAIPMVMFGNITRESAQTNGRPAGECAVLLK